MTAPVIWLHCGTPDDVAAAYALHRRFEHLAEPIRCFITTAIWAREAARDALPEETLVELPADSPVACRKFLDTHAPDALVWIGGALRPTLLKAVEKSALPATLVNADLGVLLGRGVSWLPRAMRNSVAMFDRILTRDGSTAAKLTRAGVPDDRIVISGPIEDEADPPDHDKYEFTVMSEALGTRPLWLAAQVARSEVSHLATAQRAASRKGHRLMLLLSPADPVDGPEIATELAEHGLQTGLRSNGDDPTEEMQAYVVDTAGELGMWYRLAPITYAGGSLIGASVVDPFDATALGSVVVHGVGVQPFDRHYERLTTAGACRQVRSAGELGIALGVLIAPERAARMALAGWEEITRNTLALNDLMDHLAQRVGFDTLDR